MSGIVQPPSGKWRAAAMLVGLGIAVAIGMVPFLPGLFGAAVLHVLTVRAHKWLVKKRVPPALAAGTMLLAVLLVLLVPGGWLVGMLVDQVPRAVALLDAAPIAQRLQGIEIGPFNLGEQVARAGGQLTTAASKVILGMLGGAATATLNLVIALLGLYYLLLSADHMWPALKRYLPFTDGDSEELRQKFYEVTNATVVGVVAVACLQGALVGLAFAVVGLPNAVVWGTVTAVASVLPLVGSALVWGPGAIALVGTGEVGRAIGLALFGLVVVSNVDNVFRPLVLRAVGNLHPLTTLLGAFAGVQYFGLIGILLGPLGITWFFELLVIYDREYGLVRPASAHPPATPPAGEQLPRAEIAPPESTPH
jgi:predicted PurR-regulated permease PerM